MIKINVPVDDERRGLPSASSAHRWMLCPGSHLSSREVRALASEAAEEGTWLHQCMETDERPESLTDEQRSVLDQCVKVRDRVTKSLLGENFVEKREIRLWIRNNELIPVCSAKLDYLAINFEKRCGVVIDYKFGRGQKTVALAQYQLGVQAIGAAEEYDLDSVYVMLIEPRIHSWDRAAHSLYTARGLALLREELLRKATRALQPDQPRIAGSFQCAHCPLKSTCAEAQSFALVSSEDAALSDPKRIAHILSRCEQAESVIAALRDRAKRLLADNPAAIPGWELRQGKLGVHALEQAMREKMPKATTKAVKAKVDEALNGCVDFQEVVSRRKTIVDKERLLNRLHEDFGFTEPELLRAAGKLVQVQPGV